MLANFAAQIFTNQRALVNLSHRTSILEVLLEVGSVLGKYPNVKDVFNDIFSLLGKELGVTSSAIYRFDDVMNELLIISSSKYSDDEKELGRYKPGEGITGTVFKTKKPISIADISEDTNFLNKTGRKRSDEKISFFASPVFFK